MTETVDTKCVKIASFDCNLFHTSHACNAHFNQKLPTHMGSLGKRRATFWNCKKRWTIQISLVSVHCTCNQTTDLPQTGVEI